MDLGTIRTRLRSGKQQQQFYKSFHQVAADVRLVWTNCMTYNADGSDFYKLAESLQKKWEDKYTKLLHECQPPLSVATTTTSMTHNATAAATPSSSLAAVATAEPSNSTTTTTTTSINSSNKVSLNDKKAFCRSLYQISKEDLGKVLVQVEAKCPAALIRNASEQQVELNVDQLTAAVLQELQTFCHSVKNNTNANTTCSSSSSNKKKAAAGTTNNNNSAASANGAPLKKQKSTVAAAK
jgi:hypothetical protein